MCVNIDQLNSDYIYRNAANFIVNSERNHCVAGRYGLEQAPPGPPPGFVPIGVPPGHPPNSRGQEGVAPLPPMPPPVEKSQDVSRDGPPLPTSAPGLPPSMLPPPFGLPNMPRKYQDRFDTITHVLDL